MITVTFHDFALQFDRKYRSRAALCEDICFNEPEVVSRLMFFCYLQRLFQESFCGYFRVLMGYCVGVRRQLDRMVCVTVCFLESLEYRNVFHVESEVFFVLTTFICVNML